MMSWESKEKSKEKPNNSAEKMKHSEVFKCKRLYFSECQKIPCSSVEDFLDLNGIPGRISHEK